MERIAIQASAKVDSSVHLPKLRRNKPSQGSNKVSTMPRIRLISSPFRNSRPHIGYAKPERFRSSSRDADFAGPGVATASLKLQVKKQVRSFWQNSPCDSWFTDADRGTLAFYRDLDEHRYKVHRQLLSAVEFEKTRGMRVLEIGCGCGSEAERFVRAGARYTAIDLTNAAVSLTQRRFQLANLEGRFVQGDAENLPFADGSFDLVYSHGVLHHTPDTPRSIREVYRVLATGGRAMIMLYYRNSFNYQVNLRVLRRWRAHLLKTELGIKLVRKIWHEPEKGLRRHAELVKQDLNAYLVMQNILNRNTDGPDNPLSQVFSKESAGDLFHQFETVDTEVMFWNPRWLPIVGALLPQRTQDWLAARWGWHLWIYANKSPQKCTTEEVRSPGLSWANQKWVANFSQ
jgi:ubiquinone/menaquinone biosynthesis C-methylase UbiE